MEAILEAAHLVKTYGGVKAVADVSLRVAPGECLALLGPNGAGKTTTVEMLEGLKTPDGGEIRIFGLSLATDRQAIMESVGVLLQETNLYKKLTVRETLALFASFFKKSLPVEQIMARLELTEKADSRLEHLSGGQKQRAYLGCALINDPKLVFLDEPTTGLDPQARRMIWDLLEDLKRDGRSILLTTHYMDEAEKLADRVAVIDHGNIIAEGTPDELIRTTCGERILSFSFATDDGERLERELAARLPWLASAINHGGQFELVSSEPVTHIQELTRAADALAVPLATIEIRRSTLEDVFLRLTGRSMRDA